MRLRRALAALVVAVALPLAALSGGARAAGPAPLNPAQTAYLKAESRRIEDRFVADVARIAGASPTRVRRAMPDERRITGAASRLISALEMDLGALSEAQKAAIVNADLERKQALSQARASASRH
jgi:hypothetical protein